ncbi:hypothetical protein ES703_62918 [subsurface metagenome]
MSRGLPALVAVFILIAVIATPCVASPATATRTLPASVASAAEFDVAIEPSGCGAFGQVVETLPDGFIYISCTPSDVGVEQVGHTIKFTFLGSAGFTYRVSAPTVETTTTYTFHGVVKDENKNEYPVKDDDITVLEPSGGTPGDANLDGVIDMSDVTKVERIILGLDDPTRWADANQDGEINMADVTKIERIILGVDC